MKHPIKATLKSPVIVEVDKFILIIFTQTALKDSRKFPLPLREHKKIKKVLSFTPDTLSSKCPLLLEGVIKTT